MICGVLMLCLASCSDEKSEVKNKGGQVENDAPMEKTEPNYKREETLFQYICETGVPRFLDQALPEYQLKAALVNSHSSVLFYYNEEKEQVIFYVEEIYTVMARDYTKEPLLKFDSKRPITAMYFTRKKGKITRKEAIVSAEEVPPGLPLGWGFQLKRNESFTFKITLQDSDWSQDIMISYTPDTGWESQSSKIRFSERLKKAQVFTFAKETMISQFQKAFKGWVKGKYHSCVVRTSQVEPSNKTLKFELLTGDDFESQPDIMIVVDKDKIFIDGVEQNIAKSNDSQVIRNISWHLENAMQETESFKTGYPALVGLTVSNTSNDKLVRLVIASLLELRSSAHFLLKMD